MGVLISLVKQNNLRFTLLVWWSFLVGGYQMKKLSQSQNLVWYITQTWPLKGRQSADFYIGVCVYVCVSTWQPASCVLNVWVTQLDRGPGTTPAVAHIAMFIWCLLAASQLLLTGSTKTTMLAFNCYHMCVKRVILEVKTRRKVQFNLPVPDYHTLNGLHRTARSRLASQANGG